MGCDDFRAPTMDTGLIFYQFFGVNLLYLCRCRAEQISIGCHVFSLAFGRVCTWIGLWYYEEPKLFDCS